MYAVKPVENSAVRAGAILDAWSQCDFARLNRELSRAAECPCPTTRTTLEDERRELLGSVAHHLSQALALSEHRTPEMDFVPADFRLLEHLLTTPLQ
ncbi:MAG: hypothetical protein U0Q18_09575 [Bryobacteraceae bacterium]